MIDELDTPALIIDMDVLERNIARMAGRTAAAGLRLRPHAKTHKCPEIARRQLAAGAAGITVAKLGEAEVMAQAGIDDLLVAFPLVGRQKMQRLKSLARTGVRLRLVCDNQETGRSLSVVGQALGRPLEVLLEVNTGQDRCGTAPGIQTLALAALLRELPGIRIVGLLTHGGHAYAAAGPAALAAVAAAEARLLVETARLVQAELGLVMAELSVGSTPAAAYLQEAQGATEVRPGTYVFNDAVTVGLGAAGWADCAATVLTTVCSRPAADRAVFDAGSKALAADLNRHRPGHGYLPAYPEVVIERLSEEHGIARLPAATDLPLGRRVRVVPNHICPVVNLFDHAYGVRGREVICTFELAARGKVT